RFYKGASNKAEGREKAKTNRVRKKRTLQRKQRSCSRVPAGRACASHSEAATDLTQQLDLDQPESHELAESICGSGLLRHAAYRRAYVRLSRRTKTSRVSRRRPRRRPRFNAAGRNHRTGRWPHDRSWFSDTYRGVHCSR